MLVRRQHLAGFGLAGLSGIAGLGLRCPRFARFVHSEHKHNRHLHDVGQTNELSQSHSHSHGNSHGNSHGHSHSHSLTGELLSSGNLRSPAVRITLIGFVVNCGMAAGKAVGGVVFNSQSLIADSIHALSDLVSDVITLGTVSVATKTPNQSFPHGYGRIEALGALGVSSLLLAAGGSMGYGSLVELSGELGLHLPLLGGGHTHKLPAEWSAAYIALASIFVKEALYQATAKVARKQNSPVLMANAWHHRVDCLVSAVAVASISLGQVMQASWVDPLGGLVVSAMIVRAGWQPTRDAVLELSGNVRPALESPQAAQFRQKVDEILKTVAPSYEIVECLLEPYGSTFVGTVRLANVDAGVEEVAKKLKEELMEVEHMRQVNVEV